MELEVIKSHKNEVMSTSHILFQKENEFARLAELFK